MMSGQVEKRIGPHNGGWNLDWVGMAGFEANSFVYAGASVYSCSDSFPFVMV